MRDYFFDQHGTAGRDFLKVGSPGGGGRVGGLAEPSWAVLVGTCPGGGFPLFFDPNIYPNTSSGPLSPPGGYHLVAGGLKKKIADCRLSRSPRFRHPQRCAFCTSVNPCLDLLLRTRGKVFWDFDFLLLPYDILWFSIALCLYAFSLLPSVSFFLLNPLIHVSFPKRAIWPRQLRSKKVMLCVTIR